MQNGIRFYRFTKKPADASYWALLPTSCALKKNPQEAGYFSIEQTLNAAQGADAAFAAADFFSAFWMFCG